MKIREIIMIVIIIIPLMIIVMLIMMIITIIIKTIIIISISQYQCATDPHFSRLDSNVSAPVLDFHDLL